MGSSSGNFTKTNAFKGGLIAGPIGLVAGANMDAGASAAQAQQNIANAQLAQQQSDRTLASSYAEATPQELTQLQQAITTNNQDISNRQKILDSADPALIEAGHQALSLMQGKDASTLAPIRNQRAADRQALTSQLQQQLGSGYATSSAGIQALNNFDMQTSNLLANQQNQTLQSFLGVTSNAAANNSLLPTTQMSLGIGNAYGNIQGRKISAINGTPINSAGAQYVGDLANAKNTQALIGQATGLATTLGAAYLGGGAGLGAAKATQAGTSLSQTGGTPYTDSNYQSPTMGSSWRDYSSS